MSEQGGVSEQRGVVGPAIAFGLLAYLLPILRLAEQITYPGPYVFRMTVVAALATVAVSVVAPRLAPGPLVVVLAAAAAVPTASIAGRIGAWSFVAAIIALWGAFGRPPLRALPSPPDLSVVLIPLGIAAGVFGSRDDNWVGPAFLVVALVLVALGAARPRVALSIERPFRWLQSVLVRFGAVVGRAIGWVAMWLIAFGVVLIPWVVQRVLRWDPLWSAASASGRRWTVLDGRPPEPNLRWSREPSSNRSVVRSVHSFAVAVVGIFAVVFYGLVIRNNVADLVNYARGPDDPPPVEASTVQAVRQEPWLNEMGSGLQNSMDRSRISQYVGLEMADVTSRYVNIEEGQRQSWTPPESSCPAVKVWMFGGSTLFGVGQRDNHTIPSELARLAASRGLAVEAVNWGVPGDVSWQEFRRLERELARRDPPDLVVFYDGFNDLRTTDDASALSWVEPGEFTGPFDRVQMRALAEISRRIGEGKATEEIVVRVPGLDEFGPPGGGTDAAIAQYGTTDDLTRRVLGTYGVPFVHFLQPMQATRDRPVDGEPPFGQGDAQATRRFVEQRPPDVVDLSGLFDEQESVYVDLVHIAESANVAVATALLDELTPQLTSLAQAKAGVAAAAAPGGAPCS